MKRCLSIGLLLLVALAALPAGASTFVAMTQKDLLRHSTAVVQGKVLRVSSFWEPSGRIIVTEAMVQVEEAVVGESPSVVVLRTFGGTVAGYTVEAHGFPVFNVNDRLLLFVGAENRDGVVEVVGYRQGEYRLVRSQSGEMAVPLAEGGSLVTLDGSPVPRAQTLPLETLKASIRRDAGRVPLLQVHE